LPQPGDMSPISSMDGARAFVRFHITKRRYSPLVFLSILIRMRVWVDSFDALRRCLPWFRRNWLSRNSRLASVATLVALACFPLAGGFSQQVPQINGGLPGPGRNSQGFPALPETANPRPDSNRVLEDSMHKQSDAKRFKELNELRQKEMTSDTAKLVALASDLKDELGKTGQETLSMNAVRKAEQIEKLAHDVRDRMKATISN
jgi:hypothetical protein